MRVGDLAITPGEFKRLMEVIHDGHKADREDSHGQADTLLCDVLISLGYDDGVAIFNKLDKWYA